jgi:hypothetical protein
MSSDKGDTARGHLPQKRWIEVQDASVRDILEQVAGVQQNTVEKTVANCVPIMRRLQQRFLERGPHEVRGLQPRTSRILSKQNPKTLLLHEKRGEDENRI